MGIWFVCLDIIPTAKNVVLAGVRSVTLHDEEVATVADLSSQFYLTEKGLDSLLPSSFEFLFMTPLSHNTQNVQILVKIVQRHASIGWPN